MHEDGQFVAHMRSQIKGYSKSNLIAISFVILRGSRVDRGYQILCNSIPKLSLSTAIMRNGDIGRAIGGWQGK